MRLSRRLGSGQRVPDDARRRWLRHHEHLGDRATIQPPTTEPLPYGPRRPRNDGDRRLRIEHACHMGNPGFNAASNAGDMRTARCSCGSVEIEAFGAPIMSVVCYCDSCQQGSRQIDALPKAIPILGPDGGTAYVLYRKDRIQYAKGAELLKGYKIEEKSATSRVVATCCNSAMVMRFDDARHWVPVYRARFAGDTPPLQWRICTKFKPENARIPTDIQSSVMYPAGFAWKLLTSKLSMLFSR